MYCMSDVFNYCNNFSKNNYDTKTKYNKLNNIIEFLKNYYNNKFKDNNYYFFKDILNIEINKLDNKYKGHKINFESVIFLSCLCENEHLLFFKNLLKNKYFTEKESEEWFLAINKTLSNFKVEYENKTKKKNWDNISTVMQSIFYEFTCNKDVEYIDKKIIEICINIISLPDDSKKKLFDESIKSRFDYIEKKINNIVKELDIHERYLYNIDRNMYKNENINIKIKKRIN